MNLYGTTDRRTDRVYDSKCCALLHCAAENHAMQPVQNFGVNEA